MCTHSGLIAGLGAVATGPHKAGVASVAGDGANPDSLQNNKKSIEQSGKRTGALTLRNILRDQSMRAGNVWPMCSEQASKQTGRCSGRRMRPGGRVGWRGRQPGKSKQMEVQRAGTVTGQTGICGSRAQSVRINGRRRPSALSDEPDLVEFRGSLPGALAEAKKLHVAKLRLQPGMSDPGNGLHLDTTSTSL
ncbi:hypothetical protein GGX14DRAFT_392099 [Mycena pura]|uniref:Uncharacterized protein n=1 Tax=Mycena pura TaxID=153505 RepID=A0AAD6VNE8_9AGAR|nr:hypothetical protein GGX14DRAFT_392099 [Mycena pura]